MVDREQVLHVAALARLALTDVEIDAMQASLQQILEAFEVLSTLDVADVSPTAQVIPLETIERPDILRPPLSREDVLRNAPRIEQGQIRVPAVLDES
jgi:aspartyl-tRNA(Asn)/glutamyl-tRNA(Gln) amidotransferase subunit C